MINFEGAIVDDKASFVYFVYPFLFETKEFETRVDAIASAKLPQKEQLIWNQDKFLEDNLLPHVANYLNPQDNTPNTASLWKLNPALPDIFGVRYDWKLVRGKQEEIPFTFSKGKSHAVQLVMFKVGVGFLVVLAQPKETSQVNDWLNFLHFFRFTKGQRQVKIKAQRRTGLDPQTQLPQFSPFFPEIAGGVKQHPDGIGELDTVLSALLKTGCLQGEKDQCWWRDVFIKGQMLSFAALFVDKLPENEPPYLLYKLHNFFNANQGENPAPEDLQLDNSAIMPYAQGQWFIFSLEGGNFLASNPPQTQFFRETLPVHLREQYFLLFLLALHQRFTLMMLSTTVAQNWQLEADVQRNTEVFQNIRNQLLIFTARGYFTQAMQREHHHRCYRKWQEVFLLEQLYQQVNNEVREMQEYSLMQEMRHNDEADKERDRQLQNTVYIVSTGLGAGAIVASCVGLLIPGNNAPVKLPFTSLAIHPFIFAVGLSLFSAVAFGGIIWQLRKMSDKS